MPGPVRSLSQGFAILRLLAIRPALTLSDIARETGLSPSSCFNLLRTLLAEGALVREGDGKRYGLAPGWGDLSVLRDGDVLRLVARARPAMARFAEAHDAAIGLWRVLREARGGRLELVALAESGAATRIHMVEGQRQPIGGGATGRMLAAVEGLDEAALARRFAVVRWQKPIDFPAWAAQVALAARDGYAVDDGFGYAGICSLGTAISVAPLRFCLSASVFAGARDPHAIAVLGRALKALADDLAQG